MTDAPRTVAAGPSGRTLGGHLGDPLYRTAYFLILGSGTTAVLGFVFWTVAAHSYSARVVGISSAMISAMVLLSGACQLGLTTVLVRYVPTAGSRARSLVLTSYAVTVLLSVLVGIAAAATSPLWSSSLGFLQHRPGWFIGFVFAVAFWTVFSLQDAVMTGLDGAHWVPVENSLFSLGKLVLVLALASAAPLAGPFIAWNAPVVAAVLGVTALIFARLIPGTRRIPRERGSGQRLLPAVAAGNYAASLFSLGVTYLMPVLVADATDPTRTAYFYAPWLIATALLLLAGNTSISMTVEAALDELRLGQLFRRSLIHTLRMLIPAVVVVAVAASPILSLFGHRYAHAGSGLLRLLALAALPNAIVTLGLAVARVQERPWALVLIQAGEFIPLVAVGEALLPSHGISGVGVAFLASQGLVAVAVLMTILRPLLRRSGRAARK